LAGLTNTDYQLHRLPNTFHNFLVPLFNGTVVYKPLICNANFIS